MLSSAAQRPCWICKTGKNDCATKRNPKTYYKMVAQQRFRITKLVAIGRLQSDGSTRSQGNRGALASLGQWRKAKKYRWSQRVLGDSVPANWTTRVAAIGSASRYMMSCISQTDGLGEQATEIAPTLDPGSSRRYMGLHTEWTIREVP